MTNQTRILVRDFVVPASIGIYPHEKTSLQRIRVSLDVLLTLTEIPQDEISGTLSYEGMVQDIRDLKNTHYNLVETIAEHLAARVLRDPRAAQVSVRVEKLDIYDEGIVGTEIIRSRT